MGWQNVFWMGWQNFGGIERHSNIFLGEVAKYFGDRVPNLRGISGKL